MTDQNPLQSPTIRRGIALTNVALLLAVAFLFVDGLVRWIIVGMAVVEAVAVPRILSMVADSADADDDVGEFGESSEY